MIKNTKKVISLLLVLVLIFPQITFADLQAPITDLKITNRSSATGTDYAIEFSWTRPFSSGVADNEAYGTDKEQQHRATSYSLYYRNGTKGESYGGGKKINIEDPVTDKTEISTSSKLNYLFEPAYLEPGSIYSFYVDPTHKHLYEVILNGVASYENRDANKSSDNIKETLYLTDIEVDAEINGSDMTVTWDNPTYMGAEIFNGYKIYYQKGGSSVGVIPDNPSVIISSIEDGLKRDGSKLTYTFEADNLEVGAVYAVKVEPMFNGSVVREMNNPQVIINDEAYQVSFSPREYRTNDAYVSPGLYIMQEGLNFLRLYWDSLASSTFDITKLEVYSSKSETFDQSVLIGSLEGDSAKRINYWLTSIPDSLTFYKFIIYYKDGTDINTMDSNIVYFDPTIFEFSPYMPNIMEVDVSDSTPVSIEVLWEAFMRDPYTEVEEQNINETVNKYVDKNLDYKIWVTDDVSNYNVATFENSYVKIIDGTTLIEEEFVIDDVTSETTLVYSDILTGYYDYVQGASTLREIEENKIYYIKIQAERHLSGDLSQPAYYAVYIPPSTPIVTNPLSMNKPPFKIKINEKGVEEITETTITVEWSTAWFEIYNEDTSDWYSKVGVDEGGTIVLGDEVDSLSNSQTLLLDSDILFGSSNAESVTKIKNMLKSMGANPTEVDLLAIRYMDIEDSNYELHTTTYEYMEESGGYVPYLDTIKDEDSLWQQVQGVEEGAKKLIYTISSTNAPDTGELLPNTSYIIYFRNYIIKNNEKIYSEHPIYATGTTLKDREDLIVTPPAQVIEYVSSTYDTVTFRWEYSSQIDYELKYSNQISHYTEGGISVGNDVIQEEKMLQTENDVTYVYYTIRDLFPTTTYYAWLKGTIGSEVSDWSTVANGTTTELEAPLKPRGIGLISEELLKVINIENSTNFSKDDPYSLIFEWSRVVADDKDYGITGITDVNGTEYFGTSTYKESYGAKFNDLKANTRYYFRIRTILNAQRNDMTGEYFYSYEVELSDNPYFKDSIIIFVPNHELEVDDIDVLEAKSEWSTVLSFISGKTDSEYDGDIDPDQYPMPLDDFDITYDEENDILTYEFRSTGLDSYGNENHYVDQRFITNLQQKGYFDFVVDVTDYEGIYPKSRIVQVPSSIINAFSDTKTSLTMVADNMQLTINHDTFDGEKAFLNDSGKLQIEFNIDNTLSNKLNYGESYLSMPHNFKATVSNLDTFKEISMFNNDVQVTLKPLNQFDVIDKNVNAYQLKNDNWELKVSNIKENGSYEITTKIPNTYTLIAKEVANSQIIDDSLYNVNSELLINDMEYYVPQYDVTTTQFNNIVYAIAMNEKEVMMNERITKEKYNYLGKAGLLVSGSYVTNQQGINSLIRLYEIKTGSKINVSTDDIPNVNTVSTEYLTAIKKAYEIEMYDNISNFSSNMTFGDFIYYIDVVLSDS